MAINPSGTCIFVMKWPLTFHYGSYPSGRPSSIYRQTSVSLGSGPETGYVPKQKPTNPQRGRNLQRNVKHFWVLFLGIVIQFETCGGTSALIGQLAHSRMTLTFLVIVSPHRLILLRNTVFIISL